MTPVTVEEMEKEIERTLAIKARVVSSGDFEGRPLADDTISALNKNGYAVRVDSDSWSVRW